MVPEGNLHAAAGVVASGRTFLSSENNIPDISGSASGGFQGKCFAEYHPATGETPSGVPYKLLYGYGKSRFHSEHNDPPVYAYAESMGAGWDWIAGNPLSQRMPNLVEYPDHNFAVGTITSVVPMSWSYEDYRWIGRGGIPLTPFGWTIYMVSHANSYPVDASARISLFEGHLFKLVEVDGIQVDRGFALGDADADGEVGPGDFGRISAAFGTLRGDADYDIFADVDDDGEVGPGDYGIVSAYFGCNTFYADLAASSEDLGYW